MALLCDHWLVAVPGRKKMLKDVNGRQRILENVHVKIANASLLAM